MGLPLANITYITNTASEETEILLPAKTVFAAGLPVGLSIYNTGNISKTVLCEGKPVIGVFNGNNGTVIVS